MKGKGGTPKDGCSASFLAQQTPYAFLTRKLPTKLKSYVRLTNLLAIVVHVLAGASRRDPRHKIVLLGGQLLCRITRAKRGASTKFAFGCPARPLANVERAAGEHGAHHGQRLWERVIQLFVRSPIILNVVLFAQRTTGSIRIEPVGWTGR